MKTLTPCRLPPPQVKTLSPPVAESGKAAGEVTQIAASPSTSQVAVGHADGTVSSAAGAAAGEFPTRLPLCRPANPLQKHRQCLYSHG